MERAVIYRTLEAKPTESSLIKPGELVDLVEMTPLTLNDRRIYNQLLAHAWDRIQEPAEHVIAKRDLRGSHNANDRVGDSIERLMAAIVKVRVVRDGERAVERVQLLGSNTEHEFTRRDAALRIPGAAQGDNQGKHDFRAAPEGGHVRPVEQVRARAL